MNDESCPLRVDEPIEFIEMLRFKKGQILVKRNSIFPMSPKRFFGQIIESFVFSCYRESIHK